MTVAGTPWACVTWDGYILWWWDCPGSPGSTVGKAEDVELMISASQFPYVVHEKDLHEDQGRCCTSGKVNPTRKCTARESSLHRTCGAVHDAHETSVQAASNSLDNYLAYQWFALEATRGAAKTPLSTPVPGKYCNDTWLKFLNAVLAQRPVSTAGHCRFLGG